MKFKNDLLNMFFFFFLLEKILIYKGNFLMNNFEILYWMIKPTESKKVLINKIIINY